MLFLFNKSVRGKNNNIYLLMSKVLFIFSSVSSMNRTCIREMSNFGLFHSFLWSWSDDNFSLIVFNTQQFSLSCHISFLLSKTIFNKFQCNFRNTSHFFWMRFFYDLYLSIDLSWPSSTSKAHYTTWILVSCLIDFWPLRVPSF